MHRPVIVAALLLLCALPQFAQPAQPPTTVPPSPFAIVEFRGASPEKTFANVTFPDVAIPLTLVEQQGKATTITLEATPLVDAAGDVVQPHLASSVPAGPCETKRVTIETSRPQAGTGKMRICVDLGPRETTRVTLKASLALAGTYEMTIRVRATVGKTELAPTSYTITIGRVVAPPPVTLAPIPVHQVTARWWGGATDETIETTIYSTGGDITLAPPLLLASTVKPKSDSLAGTRSTMDFEADARPIHVTPDSPAKLTGRLTHLAQAGRHDAKLRFAPRGYSPVDMDVTVYVRESAVVAFLFILLGVLTSFAVHAWSGSIRPRLIAQERGAELRTALRAAQAKAQGDAEALQLVAEVEHAMAARLERARLRRVALTTELDIYETIVPAVDAWIALHRQLLTVRPASVRDKLLPTLVTAKGVFTADPPDPTKVQESIDAMRKLPDGVRAEIHAELTKEVDALDKKLAGDPRPSGVAIRAALQRVRDAIADKQIEKAIDAFDAARLRYVVVLAEDLRRRSAPSAEQPIGVKLADWQQLQKDTNARLDALDREGDADKAMRLLREAARDYVFRLAGALRLAAAAKLEPAGRQKVENALQPIEAQLQADDLNGAWTSLDNGQKAFATEIQAAAGKQMGLEAILATAAGAPAAPFDVMQVFGLPPSWAALDAPGAVAQARTLIKLFDVVISIIVLVAATIVGLQILWIGNPTWGGPASYAIAFLWGFAVDQFTHAGVSSLAKKTP